MKRSRRNNFSVDYLFGRWCRVKVHLDRIVVRWARVFGDCGISIDGQFEIGGRIRSRTRSRYGEDFRFVQSNFINSTLLSGLRNCNLRIFFLLVIWRLVFTIRHLFGGSVDVPGFLWKRNNNNYKSAHFSMKFHSTPHKDCSRGQGFCGSNFAVRCFFSGTWIFTSIKIKICDVVKYFVDNGKSTIAHEKKKR